MTGEIQTLKKKNLIAQKAFELIRSNETIFLDISTTNIMVAERLAKSHKRLTVVTNMIDIMQTLAVNPDITSIGTGGIMYRTVNGFMGQLPLRSSSSTALTGPLSGPAAWTLRTIPLPP